MIKFDDFQHPYAVTLTLKQGIRQNGYWTKLDNMKASRNLRYFLNFLKKQVFRRSDIRKGRKLYCVPFLETDGSGRLHYHLILDRPSHLSDAHFVAQITASWRKTDFGFNQIDAKPSDSGWISYLLKERTKPVYLDSIDWTNFLVPDSVV